MENAYASSFMSTQFFMEALISMQFKLDELGSAIGECITLVQNHEG